MQHSFSRQEAIIRASSRQPVVRKLPANSQGKQLKVSQYYGENVFNLFDQKALPKETRDHLQKVLDGTAVLTKEMAKEIAHVVMEWALEKGATHFCHWFQPLTGETAEKHDSFLSFDGERAVEKISASQFLHGEPDASSFPSGGTRSTFEARGYTTWDLSSPIFIKEGTNGKTVCIPTAFISYHGDALDSKTPLLRSINTLSKAATAFLQATGDKDIKNVTVTCGPEQEYFLIDKAFYFGREDLVMTGRTLLGSLTPKHQQLEDHYFAQIPDRVLAFMQDLEIELYLLGIPAKTRHNEVAPGQFELAPIFKEANISNDQNKLVMDTMRQVADRHQFVCLLHEKPFRGVNGSGKHLNWSMSDSKGRNLLEPGNTPHDNYCFLAMVTIVCKAVDKHAIALRSAIASHGNDHRLGANEAPPSIMSVFLGTTITAILDTFAEGAAYEPRSQKTLDFGTNQLAQLLKDNTDRNRTSPFAFTGNKFEFRAVGSSATISLPLSWLNAAVADEITQATAFLQSKLQSGMSVNDALAQLIRENYINSRRIVFNGDGYGKEWVEEAARRGLPNLRTSPEALVAFLDPKYHAFLLNSGIYKENELHSLQHVRLERYIKHREIEFNTLLSMIDKQVLPGIFTYKKFLVDSVQASMNLKTSALAEESVLKEISALLDKLLIQKQQLVSMLNSPLQDEKLYALSLAKDFLPVADAMAKNCDLLESLVPADYLPLPSYYELLFIR